MNKNYPAIKLATPANINYKKLFESLEKLNGTEKKNIVFSTKIIKFITLNTP